MENKIYLHSDHPFKALSEMTECQKKKFDFVDKHLSHLIVKMNCGYNGCAYFVDKNEEEYVKIYYSQSLDGYFVCVTADSLLALTRDTLKTID